MLLFTGCQTCPMFESVELVSRPNWKLRIVCGIAVLTLLGGLIWILRMTQMPLTSYQGPLPPLTQEQSRLRDLLSSDVKYLSATIGERSMDRVGSPGVHANRIVVACNLGGRTKRAIYLDVCTAG